jgi:hypothetical protein
MMMADQSASERADVRLKTDLLSGAPIAGPFDLRQHCDRFKMSVTPVREAIARLSAERLVKLAPHQDWAVASLSGRRMENLYAFAGDLIEMAIDRCINGPRSGATSVPARPAYRGYVDGMSRLMKVIGAAHSNLELRDHLLAPDDRLHPVRRCEPRVFPDCDNACAALVMLWDHGRLADLRTRFRDRFNSRVNRADALARQLADPAGDG